MEEVKTIFFSDEVRKNFKIITERRYEQDKFLIITAPLSRIAKILFAPRSFQHLMKQKLEIK